MSSRSRKMAFFCLAAVIAMWAGLWPYIDLLEHFPRGGDANKWVTQGSLTEPGWLSWVFLERHFVGYRPVAALSFTANSALTGWQPAGFRITDMGLHLVAGLSILGLWRALVPKGGAWGLLALLVFFAHPASENVVPHLARRSYLLATVFSTNALTAWLRAVRAPHEGHWLALSGVLLSLAVLSNEVAVVVAVWMPIVALLWPQQRATRLKQAAVPMAILAGAMALRMVFLGHMGGYKKHYFAYTHNGKNALRLMDPIQPRAIIEAAGNYLISPTSVSGDPAFWPTQFGGNTLVLALGTGLVLVSGVLALRLRRRTDALPLLLLVWIGGSMALFVISGNWFWRLGYSLITPYGLLLAYMAHEASTRTLGVRIGAWLGLGVLLAALMGNSPMIRGLDHGGLRGQFKSNAIIVDINQAVTDAPDKSTIWLGLPVTSSNSNQVVKWVRRLNPSLEFRVLARSQSAARSPTSVENFSISEVYGRDRLTLGTGMVWRNAPGRDTGTRTSPNVWLDRLHLPDRPCFVVLLGPEGPRLWPVPPLPPDLHPQSP